MEKVLNRHACHLLFLFQAREMPVSCNGVWAYPKSGPGGTYDGSYGGGRRLFYFSVAVCGKISSGRNFNFKPLEFFVKSGH